MDCDRSNITVLIVDNDDFSLEYLANILMALQYRVMSKENNVSLISKALENGAAQYIAKPFSAEDFKDIWKHVLDAKKEKLFVESLFVKNEEQETLSHETKTKKKACKRKCSDEYQEKEESQVVKKPKLVWTTYLHNLFLHAIKQIGLEKAVPKKILDMMNIPNLTRENVASHLQKYRIFLRDVAEKGMVGGITHRALRSRFASSLPVSLVKEFQTIRTNKLRTPTPEYLQTLPYRPRDKNIALNPYNQFPTHRVDQFPYVQKGLTFQDSNKVRFGKSELKTDFVDNNVHDQNMFGVNSSGLSLFQTKNLFDDGASTSFSSHGSGQGFRPYSSSFITRDSKFGDICYQNHGSMGNESFNHINHGVKNQNLGSLRSSNILPQNVASDARNDKIPFGIQINNELGTVGIGTMNIRRFNSVGKRAQTTNNNSFGLNTKDQNENMNENIVQDDGHTFTNNSEFKRMEFNISDSLITNDKNLLNQPYKSGDDISPPAETTSCVLNESSTNSDQNSNKLQVHEGFSNGEPYDRFMEENVSKTSTSTIDPELNMDLIETLFGTIEN
ncbi:hypothetical protein KIW84_013001 [Lathyrus oleraceus]|uniref:Response regulatory domain-containing protein n=1 Tax=Pisum sativum TaxID=3888 RepID=A0A9D5GX44_PEA|nr:hypothetical protein KIW84_013001 [Pisum sativum]